MTARVIFATPMDKPEMTKKPDSPAFSQSGFTLVELAVSLIVIGIVSSGALLSATQYIKAQKVQETNDKIALIENALSSYAQQHYRLPCPADPGAIGANAGGEVDGGKCFLNSASGNSQLYWETEGVVPWKELGLPQDLVVDAWNHYITYKPAPQLTVDNLDLKMQDTAATDTANDTHNACRTAMWYDQSGVHLNRGKALFCCNASPKAAYIAANPGMTAPGAGWQQNGIVDTSTAANPANVGANSLKANAPVAMSGNWMDSSTLANAHGSFAAFNDSQPEPPLMRATGLAVTLISHGGNGDLAFLPEQGKTSLVGGATVTVGTGVTSSNAAIENDNVWPPHIFSGVFGHPKVNDGSYNPLNSSPNTSDDIVSYVRSDDLFGRVGQESCEKPPAAVFQPAEPCKPQDMDMSATTFDPLGKPPITMNAIDIKIAQNEKIPYILKSTSQRLRDEAGYDNSLGLYTINADGSIGNVGLVEVNMHSLADPCERDPSCSGYNPGKPTQASISMTLPAGNASVGTFILPNGYQINQSYLAPQVTDNNGTAITNPNLVDTTKMQMLYDFGQSDQRPANITDTEPSKISLVAPVIKTGQLVALTGADDSGGTGVFHMYSNLNGGQIDHGWRAENHDSKSVVGYVGPAGDGDMAGKIMQTGFEDLSSVNCWYTNGGDCVNAKPAKPASCYDNTPGGGACDTAPTTSNPAYAAWLATAKLDQYGGYEANIGDNDYDDVASTISMNKCAPQD